MPSVYLKKIAKDKDMDIKELEKLWAKAKNLAHKQLGKEAENDKIYPYTMGIFKKMIKESSNNLLKSFMRQDKSFSEFYKKFKEFDTGDSTSFIGKTPQKIVNVKQIEDEDEEDDFKGLSDISTDYEDDDGVYNIGQYVG